MRIGICDTTLPNEANSSGAGVGFPWGFYTMDESRAIGKKIDNPASLDGLQELANTLAAAEMTGNRQGRPGDGVRMAGGAGRSMPSFGPARAPGQAIFKLGAQAIDGKACPPRRPCSQRSLPVCAGELGGQVEGVSLNQEKLPGHHGGRPRIEPACASHLSSFAARGVLA